MTHCNAHVVIHAAPPSARRSAEAVRVAMQEVATLAHTALVGVKEPYVVRVGLFEVVVQRRRG